MQVKPRNQTDVCSDLPDPDLQTQCRLPAANLAERKAAETGEVGTRALHVAVGEAKTHVRDEGGKEVVKKLTPKLFSAVEPLAKRLGPLAAGIAGTKAIKEFASIFTEHAKLRADAIGRENHNLGMAFVAEQAKPGTFPAGYIAHQREHLMGPNAKLGDTRHSPHVANKVIDAMDDGIEAKNAATIQYRSYWIANAGAGVREAHTRGVRDEKSLEEARKDEPFRVAYDQDPAFREGVRAAIWQASAHPAAFDEAQKHASALHDGVARAAAGRLA